MSSVLSLFILCKWIALFFMLCHTQALDVMKYSGNVISEGAKFKIFQPFKDNNDDNHHRLVAPPEGRSCCIVFLDIFAAGCICKFVLVWLQEYEERVVDIRQLVFFRKDVSARSIASDLYLETLRQMVLGLNFGKHELSVTPKLNARRKHRGHGFNALKREEGYDWPGFAYTMAGNKRLASVMKLLEQIFQNKIAGDVLEAGVWRGGMSIFMRGFIRVNKELERKSYVCDSFRGLPPSTLAAEKNISWDNTPYLEVSDDKVRRNFQTLGLSDPNVVFVKGFFSDSLRELKNIKGNGGKFALLRLDGDMYESTMDVLYNLYDSLSIGGYLIMDDWYGFPSKDACEDFFRVHNIQPAIIRIDNLAVYWEKTADIDVQFWRYEQKKYTE